MAQDSFTSFLPNRPHTITGPSNRTKRAVAESRDATASKRRRTMMDEDSLFCSDGDDSDDEVLRVTEPDINGGWSYTSNIDGRTNGRINSSTTTTQVRPPAPPPVSVATNSTISSKAQSVHSPSQPKSTAKVNGTASLQKPASTEIKEEPEKITMPAWIEDTEEINRIRIFIGRKQRQTFATREDIAKSPILTGYIVEDTEHGPFIMRPQLLRTDPSDFDAILQFIHTGIFEPLVDTSKDDGAVFKNVTSDADYGKELVRLGKIYNIAQMFKVDGLEAAIYDKVCAIDARRFPNSALVELACVIFNNKRVRSRADSAQSDSATSSQTGQEDTDKFEEWIITRVASNFQEIQKQQHAEFWVVEKKTTKKMFYARVLELAAEIYRANSGKLPGPAVVELD